MCVNRVAILHVPFIQDDDRLLTIRLIVVKQSLSISKLIQHNWLFVISYLFSKYNR